MNSTPYHIFINFVEFDQKLDQKKRELDKKKTELATLYQEKKEYLEKHEKERLKVHDLKKKVDAFELDLKTLRDREKTKKNQLEHVSSAKEYISLEHELGLITTQYKTIDDQLFEVWQEYELAQSSFLALQETYTREVADMNERITQSEAFIAQLTTQISGQEAEREEIRKQVKDEWLTQYDGMKERVSNPVVPVEHNVCKGCFFPVASHDITALRRHKLLACRECFRLLYLND